MAKRKNDERFKLNKDGEIVEADWTDVDIKTLTYYPFVVIIGVICLLAGLTIGLIVQALADRYNPDDTMKNIVYGCLNAFDTNTPDDKNVLDAYYKSSRISDSLIDCMKSAELETFDITTSKKINSESLRLYIMGCLGGSSVTYNNYVDKDARNRFFDCLIGNNLHFRFIGPPLLILTSTPDPYATLPPL
jgi:hypothetical protein